MRTKTCATLLAFTAVAAYGHYTWVAPAAPLTPGKTVKIMVAHGDRFPHGDEAINAAQVKLWMLTPQRAKIELKPTATPTTVQADFTVAGTGPYRIIFKQDRGVMSRTPKGVKAGGRDKNPTATEVFSMMRTGLNYIGEAAAGSAPVGLELELTARFENGVWNLQLLRSGKPLAGETVKVVLKDQETETAIGKSGSDGTITFKPAAGYKGPLLFLVDYKEKLTGGPVDSINISTSTFVTCI